jgi:hypothetical protein
MIVMETHGTAQELNQENEINLCDSCRMIQPNCISDDSDIIFGTGIGYDNTIACNKYQPVEIRHPKWRGQEI